MTVQSWGWGCYICTSIGICLKREFGLQMPAGEEVIYQTILFTATRIKSTSLAAVAIIKSGSSVAFKAATRLRSGSRFVR
jgi:hypothetical protein